MAADRAATYGLMYVCLSVLKLRNYLSETDVKVGKDMCYMVPPSAIRFG